MCLKVIHVSKSREKYYNTDLYTHLKNMSSEKGTKGTLRDTFCNTGRFNHG